MARLEEQFPIVERLVQRTMERLDDGAGSDRDMSFASFARFAAGRPPGAWLADFRHLGGRAGDDQAGEVEDAVVTTAEAVLDRADQGGHRRLSPSPPRPGAPRRDQGRTPGPAGSSARRTGRDRPLRRAWLVRRRYKGVRWAAAVLGGLAAALSSWSTYLWLAAAQGAPGGAFLVGVVLLVALGAAGGWLLVELPWRRVRRRNRWRWQ